MTLGEFIKQYREEHSLSYEEFGKLCGFSKSYVYALEKNEHPKTKEPIQPSFSILSFISKGTGTPLLHLCSILGVELSFTSNSNNFYLSEEEIELITKFRESDLVTKNIVRKILCGS